MTDKYLLVEKFIDGRLSEEEQNFIAEELRSEGEFKDFWTEAMKDVAAAQAVKGSEETEAFLSTALFLDRKIIKQRKKKSPFVQFLKIAAILALAFLGYQLAMIGKSVYPGKVVYSATSSYKTGQQLTYGRQNITSGVLHVDFKGNQLIFEGPAAFTLNNQTGLYLNKGRVYIDASKSSGLKIHVGGHYFEDIGTKFGVKTGIGSEVHVFEGKVKSGSQEVTAGSALKVTGGKSKAIPIKRGAFISPKLLDKMDKNRSYYLNSRENLLNYEGLVKYYDFMSLKNSYIADLEKQGVSVSGAVPVSGPCSGSTALLFAEGAKLEIPVPEGDFSFVFEYYYEQYSPKGQFLMMSESGNLKVKQKMKWFKDQYWDSENNIMGEKFYQWRTLSVTRIGSEYRVSNNNDVNALYKFMGSPGKILIFGNSGDLNFEGRLARIAVLKPVDISTIAKFFKKY